ncbi:hypothetical protein [Kutzneria sp. NPDC052558]|uniref:hypothetical protein n=1 Tax=Kutzneria sp. NPDC052558 TaxID=3364121 RepID=UPI0037C7723F
MRQHREAAPNTTTEDIATDDIARVDERPRPTPINAGRSDKGRPNATATDTGRTDSGSTDSGSADTDRTSGRLDADPVDSDRSDADRVESERVDADRTRTDLSDRGRTVPGADTSGPVEVDETARPADTKAAGQVRPGETGSRHTEATSGETGQRTTGASPREAGASTADLLFDQADAARFRERWREVQTGFVDDPKRAVQDADVLVAELMREVASAFSQRKRVLEGQWREGSDAETEDLRLALRGYRAFVDQLLAH